MLFNKSNILTKCNPRGASVSHRHISSFGSILGKRWLSWPLIGWDIFDIPSIAEWNWTKLVRNQVFNVHYQVLFSGPNRKQRWLPWHLIGWKMSDFFSGAMHSWNRSWRNLTVFGPILWPLVSTFLLHSENGILRNFERKQVFNVLYRVCFSFSGWSKNKGGWDMFDISLIAERNLTNLDKTKEFNALFKVCVFKYGLVHVSMCQHRFPVGPYLHRRHRDVDAIVWTSEPCHNSFASFTSSTLRCWRYCIATFDPRNSGIVLPLPHGAPEWIIYKLMQYTFSSK